VVFAALLRLLFEAGQQLRRSEIQSLLWPDARDADARHRLRQTIYSLKRSGIGLIANGTHIKLAADEVKLDFRDAIKNSQQDCAPLLKEFLPDYAPTVSHAYARWLQGVRDQVNLQIRNALLTAIGVQRQEGRWLNVQAVAVRCLEIDPLNEEATLALAEARAMGGNKLEAVRLLDRYKKDLEAHAPNVGLPSALLRKRISDRFVPAESPLVGRESAIAAMTTVVRHMRPGTSGGYLITGGAGLGKTRLIEEVKRIAALEGVTVVQAECLPSESQHPLSALTKIVPVIQRLPGSIGCSPRSVEYLKKLTEEPIELPVGYRGEDAPSFIYSAIKRSVLDLIAAVTHEINLVIVIDDIDQADEQSIETIADLVSARHTKSLFVLITARDLSGSVARLTAVNRGLRSHALTPLNPEDSRKLLRLLTSAYHGGLNEDLQTLYVEMARGNPLFIHDLARYWESCGHLNPIPPSIESALNQRVGSLTENDLRVLQTIALLGQHATTGRLVRLLELPEADLLNRIESLEQRGFARWEHDIVRCVHNTLANLVRERLSMTASLSCHGKIADLLQSELEPPRDSRLLWDCANHYRLAGFHREAIAMFSRCGDRLLKLGLPHEAASMWERVFEWCHSDAERVLVQERIIPTLLAIGDLARVSRAGGEVGRLRQTLQLGNSTWSEWQIDVLEARMFALEDVEPILIEASTCLADESTKPSIRVRAGICAMICAFNLHDPARLRHFYDVLLSLADEGTVRPVDRLTMSMVFNTYIGDLEKGAEAGSALVTYARLTGSLAFLGQSLRRHALALRLLGRFSDAHVALNEALQLAKWMGSRSYMLATLIQIGEALIEQGELKSARDLLNKAITTQDRRRFPYRAIAAAQLKAMIALIDGNKAEAIRICDSRTFRKWRNHTSHSSGRIKYGALAVSTLLAVSRGRARRPTKHLLALEHEFTRLQGLGNQDFAAFALCKSLLAHGHEARAQTILVSYLQNYRRERFAAPTYLAALLKHELGQVSSSGDATATL
jgi:DNA-binding SARP family transcriptional activator